MGNGDFLSRVGFWYDLIWIYGFKTVNIYQGMRELRFQKLRQEHVTTDIRGLGIYQAENSKNHPPPGFSGIFRQNRGISKAMFAFTSTFELYQETARFIYVPTFQRQVTVVKKTTTEMG